MQLLWPLLQSIPLLRTQSWCGASCSYPFLNAYVKQAETPRFLKVGLGLAQDVVKETSGLTAIREPLPGFKHKTQYFLRG